jgi:Leucine-rich repeat (LRR) protein
LDDVWNRDIDKWRKLKACLIQGIGCAVLVTTREKQIAQLMGTVVDNSWTNNYHEVTILGKEYIQEIIETRAFSLPKSKSDYLVKLAGLIAERCVGSPLAAKAIGSVLRNKTTNEEWEDVLQRSTICDDETGILPILKLSYNDLPIDMKQCFAFCALYPKDYEIGMDNLIQLWMANGFISDRKKVPAETVGRWIVNEMVSRSFFQYEEQSRIGYISTRFLKIHDLMHDVALSVSEKDCFCITDEFITNRELLPSAARHILFPTSIEEEVHGYLFASMRKMSRPIQTLMFDGPCEDVVVQHLSRYNSLRVLSVAQSWGHLPVKPRHQYHLRFLDITDSTIKELPDDISILYNLQTLNLSGCSSLIRLPEQMKHMSALRHLYTDGCTRLECMPPELGQITSLRTITWFVVGSGLSCSSLAELKDLNIGGSLILKKLENVPGRRNAKAASLENKKELRQLSLEWTSGKEEEQQCHEVLESLETHDGLLALEIYYYKGTSFPSWLGMLKNMVELRLSNCRKAEQLPPLCQLAELQLLHLKRLGNLRFLCSSCTSSTFGKLKDLKLVGLDVFEGICEAVDGGAVAFPRLEKLNIKGCGNLVALPDASVLGEAYCSGDYTVARSAFPELKRLILEDLCIFERWEAAPEIEGHALFPVVEVVVIRKCPKLTTLPWAPKLKELVLRESNEQISLGGIKCVTSLSTLFLEGVKLEDGKERWDQPPSVVSMQLWSCILFFQPRALALWWVCFGQLQDLEITGCDDLVYWPEKAFQSLISLRRLRIAGCNNLIGYATANGPDQATSGRSQLLPHLESLLIEGCQCLAEVFNSSPVLKRMDVIGCPKLESLYGKQQLNEEASSSDAVMASAPVEEKLSPSDKLLPSSLAIWDCHGLLSSLESLRIWDCHGLSEVVNLPSSLRKIDIRNCSKLRFMSGQLDALNNLLIVDCPELRSLETCIVDLPSLESLDLRGCESLASLPCARAGPQEYSSLRHLTVGKCPSRKSLPSVLHTVFKASPRRRLGVRAVV